MSNNNIKITVVMPVYNKARFLKNSIESILNQSFSDFELIIVDDASTDNSYEIMQKYAEIDKRVVIYQNKKNKGVSMTRNFAVSKAKCNLIAFIDGDDMWVKTKLEKQLNFMNDNPNVDLCYTAVAFIDTNFCEYHHIFKVPAVVKYNRLLRQNVISCSSVLIKKSWLERYPMVDDDMHEDFVTWLLVLKNGGVAQGINEPLLIYRLDQNSKSGNKIKSLLMTYKVYKYVGVNLFRRLYSLVNYFFLNAKKYSLIKMKSKTKIK